MLNVYILSDHVGADPEIRYSQEGKPIRFSKGYTMESQLSLGKSLLLTYASNGLMAYSITITAKPIKFLKPINHILNVVSASTIYSIF